MSKCYINANFGQNKIISSGDIEQNIYFCLNSACFVCSKSLSRLKHVQVLYHASLVKIKLLVQEILSKISLFGLNLAFFCLQWP